MYLSYVEVDAGDPRAMRLLSSPYRMHAAVEAAFPSKAQRSNDGEGRILWRLDGVPSSDAARLYIASPDAPNLASLAAQLGTGGEKAYATKDYEPFLGRLRLGGVWRFRLKANPVRKVFRDQGHRAHPELVGTIQGHVTERQQRQWLLDRAERSGFQVLEKDGEACLSVSQRFRERFKRGGGEMTLSTAVYDGVLGVTDVERFRHTLTCGLGRAKGFGCGLMTIVPCA